MFVQRKRRRRRRARFLHTYTEFPNKEERTIWTAGTKRELMISLHFVVDLVRSVVRPRSRRRRGVVRRARWPPTYRLPWQPRADHHFHPPPTGDPPPARNASNDRPPRRPRMTVGRESEATTVLADAPYLACVCVYIVCVCGGENSLERRRWRRVRGTTVCGLTNVVRPNRRKQVDELWAHSHTTSLLFTLDVYCMGNGSVRLCCRCVRAVVVVEWTIPQWWYAENQWIPSSGDEMEGKRKIVITAAPPPTRGINFENRFYHF